MHGESVPIDDGGPRSRADQQRRTREALVASARAVFARQGFHGASLATVAREAGLSKGAVYSNFESKSALFLAVLDSDLARLDPDAWDPTERYDAIEQLATLGRDRSRWPQEASEGLGFGLATFEFVASAARDPAVSAALAERLDRLLTGFTAVARRERADDDPLDVSALALVLLAFDQGLMSIFLVGGARVEATVAREAVRRLLRPGTG